MSTPIPQNRRSAVPPLRLAAAVLLVALLAGCASRTRAPVEDRAGAPAKPPPSAVASPAPASPPAGPGEPDWRPSTYIVKRGDTLYQVALDHGLDYRELAAWNNIENVNLIRVGQTLRLTAPGDTAGAATGVTTAPLRTVPQVVEAKPAAPATTTGAPPPTAANAPRNTENYKSSPKALKEPYSEQAVRDVTRAAQAPPEPVALATPAPAPSTVAPPRRPRRPRRRASPATTATTTSTGCGRRRARWSARFPKRPT